MTTGLPPAPAIPRVDVIGTGISAVNRQQAINIMNAWIANHERQYICFATVHSVMESHRDPDLRAIMNGSGMTTPDGVPLVWLSRWAGYRFVNRVYGPDIMLDMCGEGLPRGYRHFLYGGAAGVAEKLAHNLCERFPGIGIVGTYCPPFRPLTADEDTKIVSAINAASPDIVWIGLGAPKQERWMGDHRSVLNGAVLMGVGAAFDFHTGRVRQAPIWMQRSGLEWLYRLCREPRRLAYRYLVYNPLFIVLMARQHLSKVFRRNGNALR